VLAPLAGITDSPFRRMCLENGAGLVVAEMVSAQALFYGNQRTRRMLKIYRLEHPVSVQIFGGEPSAMATAVKMAQDCGADIVDINSGCPVKKIIRSGSGSALMRDETKFAAIVSSAVKAASVPVTVKMRIGLKKDSVLSPRFAKIAEDCGARAVTVHGRFAEAVHSGPVNYDAIAETCAAVKIPVLGNGGVACAADALKMFSAGCAGVMVGRAAVGNPYVFTSIINELSGESAYKIDPLRRLSDFRRLIELNAEFYGEKEAAVRIRKVVGFWVRDFAGSAAVRSRFMACTDMAQIYEVLRQAQSSI